MWHCALFDVKLPSDSGDCLFVFEFAKNVCVCVGFHENFGKFLLFIGRFILLLTMIQQHVNLTDQQRFGIFKFWKGKKKSDNYWNDKKKFDKNGILILQNLCLFLPKFSWKVDEFANDFDSINGWENIP